MYNQRMTKVKNISGTALSLNGIGAVKPDQVIEVPEGFHNANFEEVTKKEAKPKQITKD